MNTNLVSSQTDPSLSAFQHMGEGAYILDDAGRILLANIAAEKILGWSQDELKERPVKDLISTVEAHAVHAGKPTLHGEANVIRKDGSSIWIAYALSTIAQGQKNLSVLTFHDITETKQNELELQRDITLLRSMADNVGAMLWMFDANGKFLYLNKIALEYLGAPFSILKERVGAIKEFPETGIGGFVHPDDAANAAQKLEQALLTRGSFLFEHRVRSKNGHYRWCLGAGGPVFTEDGEYIGLVGSTMDIHDLKVAEMELTRYAQQLAQSNKELEHFATIASHDLQEPLRKVILFSSHLQKVAQGALNEEGLDDLKRIQSATGKMRRLIDDLLDLSKIIRRGQPFKKVDLKALMEEVTAELHYQYPDIRSRVEVNGEMMIDADPNQLNQMMSQILDNALKFHKPSQPSQVKIHIQPWESNQCRISISDDGIGIKAEHLDKIFDIFTRLHHEKDYPGTGIGLALAKKIAERHGGCITVSSAPGKGSKFVVSLPVSQNNPEKNR